LKWKVLIFFVCHARWKISTGELQYAVKAYPSASGATKYGDKRLVVL